MELVVDLRRAGALALDVADDGDAGRLETGAGDDLDVMKKRSAASA